MIISFNALKNNSGRKTLALATAKLLAEHNNKVLFVDLDYLTSDFALTYGLEHQTNNSENYFNVAISEGSFSLKSFTFKASHLKGSSNAPKDTFSDSIHFLTMTHKKDIEKMHLPTVQQWNTEQCYNFMNKFIEDLKKSEYDHIILVLPIGLDDMFNLPCILASDLVINVTTLNKLQLEMTHQMLHAFRYQDDEVQSKFKHVLSFVPKKISENALQLVTQQLEIVSIINYEEELYVSHMKGVVATDSYYKQVTELLEELELIETPKKTGILSKLKRG